MKCKICRSKAVAEIPQHRMALCQPCYLDWFPTYTRKTVKKFSMLDPGERVAGRVASHVDGSPVAGARVRGCDPGARDFEMEACDSTTTDETGRFEVPRTPPGELKVTVAKPGRHQGVFECEQAPHAPRRDRRNWSNANRTGQA